MKNVLLSFVLSVLTVASLRAETFEIDPVHSSVEFKIHHLVGNVRGHFNKFEGAFDYAADKPKAWKASATIDAASIDTSNEKRDSHLRSPDFFDVAKCPTIGFRGGKAMDVKENSLKLQGQLTLHCVTKPVTLDVEFGGLEKGPDGLQRAGATATTKINRKDFGMEWNKVLDSGGVMVGNEVQISIEIEAIAKKK